MVHICNAGSCPRVNKSVLACGQKAILSEYQRRQAFVCNFLAHQRQQHLTLIESWTRWRSDQFHRIIRWNYTARCGCILGIFCSGGRTGAITIRDANTADGIILQMVAGRLGECECLLMTVRAIGGLFVIAKAEVGQSLRDRIECVQTAGGIVDFRIVRLVAAGAHLGVRTFATHGRIYTITVRIYTICDHIFRIIAVVFVRIRLFAIFKNRFTATGRKFAARFIIATNFTNTTRIDIVSGNAAATHIAIGHRLWILRHQPVSQFIRLSQVILRDVPQADLCVLAHRAEAIACFFWSITVAKRAGLGSMIPGAARSNGRTLPVHVAVAMHIVIVMRSAATKCIICSILVVREIRTFPRWIRCVWIEGHHRHPRSMARSTSHHTTFMQWPHGHQVVFATHHHELAVWAPAHTQKSAEIRPCNALQLHRIVVEYTQKTILRHNGQHRTARWEAKFIDATIFRAERPFVQRITCRLRFTCQYRETVAHFEVLIAGCCWRARQFFVIQIQVAGSMWRKKKIWRFWQPFQACHFGLVDKSLQRILANKTELMSNNSQLQMFRSAYLFIIKSSRFTFARLHQLYLAGGEANQ